MNQVNLQLQFETQYTYLNSGGAEQEGGSRAIAAGRAAGLAWDAGHKKTAQAIWSKEIPQVEDMPSFAEFRAGYEAHSSAFSAFDDRANFSKGGTAFSNAAGSYAFALDNAVRGQRALAGGHPEDVGDWGAKALQAAGFPEQATHLNDAIVAGVTLDSVKAKGRE